MNKSAPYINNKSYRLRTTYFLLAIVTTIIGLSTRKMPHLFPGFVAEYGGDTLWALLFFLLARMIWINKPIWLIAIITYSFGVLIECSQLYQGEWIVRWRQTFTGQMLLGHGFLWSDLLCYSVGVFIGCAIAYMIEKKKSKRISAAHP
jgi:hypothetical protein